MALAERTRAARDLRATLVVMADRYEPRLSHLPHSVLVQLAAEGMRAMSGEASVTASAGPRAKRTRAFDLAFELEWHARACDTHYIGRLLFSEVRVTPLTPPGCSPTPPGCEPT